MNHACVMSSILHIGDPYESVHQRQTVSVSRKCAVSSNYSHFHIIVCVSSCKADYRSVPSYCVEKYVGSDQLHKSVITNPVLIIQCSESTYPIKAYLNRFWKCRERSHCTRKDDASYEGRNNQGKRTHRYRSLSQCCHPKSQAILERRLYHSLRSTYSSKQFPQSTKFNLRSFKISYRVWIKCGGGSCQVQESKEILLISEGQTTANLISSMGILVDFNLSIVSSLSVQRFIGAHRDHLLWSKRQNPKASPKFM
jgi:hypothetical protein